MFYPCSENKGADQLRGYREADLRLCFRLCKLLVFSCTGSNDIEIYSYSALCIYFFFNTVSVDSVKPAHPRSISSRYREFTEQEVLGSMQNAVVYSEF